MNRAYAVKQYRYVTNLNCHNVGKNGDVCKRAGWHTDKETLCIAHGVMVPKDPHTRHGNGDFVSIFPRNCMFYGRRTTVTYHRTPPPPRWWPPVDDHIEYRITLKNGEEDWYEHFGFRAPGVIHERIIPMIMADFARKDLALCRNCDLDTHCHPINTHGHKYCTMLLHDAIKPSWNFEDIL